MLYAFVIEGLPTLYCHEETDENALITARQVANSCGKILRLVFVSAHNDPANGPSVMREVFNNR